MIPAESHQAVQLGIRGSGGDESRDPHLIFLRENKPGTHGMLAFERPAGKDANAAGILDAEEDATGLPLANWRIASGLDFHADPIKYR
jgi:hypothetical protein